jgi:hypothetical protein
VDCRRVRQNPGRHANTNANANANATKHETNTINLQKKFPKAPALLFPSGSW